DDDGNAITRMEYLPYGETWFQETSADTEEEHNPKYNSQELDKETGYYYYNARHYDPEICRFVTADTVIDGQYSTQGWNRYSYVKGNPISYKDPSGHNVVTDFIEKVGNKFNGAGFVTNRQKHQNYKDNVDKIFNKVLKNNTSKRGGRKFKAVVNQLKGEFESKKYL
ncbi:MAG: RHS repeat-associated core domain-containing protein, partial [bacterium]|nr:RHS repeat-associated core domain-containing protein [bacterium]